MVELALLWIRKSDVLEGMIEIQRFCGLFIALVGSFFVSAFLVFRAASKINSCLLGFNGLVFDYIEVMSWCCYWLSIDCFDASGLL